MAKKPQRHVTVIEAGTAKVKQKPSKPKARETEITMVADPYDPGLQIEAERVRDGLSRLQSDGAISDEMYLAGRYFQQRFDEAGYLHYSKIDLMTEGSGRVFTVEDHLHRTSRARKAVDKLLRDVGYPDTQMGKAAWWIIGHGMGLERMADTKEFHGFKGASDGRYWKAMVVAALQIMERSIYAARSKKRYGKIKGERKFDASEVVVRAGTIERRK